MVHTVDILKYTPAGEKPGRMTFKLGGTTFHARCYADPKLAEGLLEEGATYPVAVTVEAEGQVEYTTDNEPGVTVKEENEAGDTVVATGRTWDAFDHQLIKLDSSPNIAVKINLPQTASDYRGGSWLKATGTLCVDLPPEDHDEASLHDQ